MKGVDKKYFNSTLEFEIKNKVKLIEREHKEKLERREFKKNKPKKKGFFGFLKKIGEDGRPIQFKDYVKDKMKLEQINLTLTQYELSKMVIEPQKREAKKGEKKGKNATDSELEEAKKDGEPKSSKFPQFFPNNLNQF